MSKITKKAKLHGVVVPVITPVDANDNVDVAAFRKVLRRLLDAKVHAIFVGGSAGEGPLLTASAWQRMVEVAFEEVSGKAFLLGGAIDTSSRRACDKVKALRKIGYRHFVLTPSFYITVKTPSQHLRLYGEARDAAGDMEMIAYNIPSCTSSVLAVDTICDMARRGWVHYCKESSGDWAYLKELIERGGDLGLTVLAGDEPTSGKALLAGAKGIVPVCANYDPQSSLRLYEAGIRGDREEVARCMKRLESLRTALLLSGACWLTGIKYAVSQLGIGSGKPVSPLEPAEPKRKAIIKALIRKDRAARRQ